MPSTENTNRPVRGPEAEQIAATRLQEEGYTVHKTGCPDFFALRSDSLPFFVEVKCPHSRLSPAQSRYHAALRAAGVRVETWYVDAQGTIHINKRPPSGLRRGRPPGSGKTIRHAMDGFHRSQKQATKTNPTELALENRIAPAACPNCGSTMKPTKRVDRSRMRKCRICRNEYSILSGTPFANTKAPLGLWAALFANPEARAKDLCKQFRVDVVTVWAIRKRAAQVPDEWKARLLSFSTHERNI